MMAIKFLLQRAGAALFLDPGLGKTSSVLAAFKVLRNKGMVKRLLVVAPRRVMYEVWPAEIAKWLDFNDITYTTLHGPHKEARLREDVDVYLINYDGLKWLISKGIIQKGYFDVLVADELSRLKHTNTQRFKALKPYLGAFKRRWGLTGTPFANGLLHIFGQMYVVDLGYSLGKYITHFRSKYFIQEGFGGYTWTLRPGADQEIFERIAPNTLRLNARDWLELPELIPSVIPVRLPKAARKAYDEMEQNLITVVGNDLILSVNAAVMHNKCQQIANGSVYNEDDGVTVLHHAKVDALEDLVEELQGQPLMVLYAYKHDVTAIRQRMPYVEVIDSDTTDKEASDIVTRWNMGEIRVLLGHPSSVSVGLNLQDGGCAHVCFFGMTWDLEKYLQSIERVLRQGNSAKQVIVYHLAAVNTVDYDMMKAIDKKDVTQTTLLEALRERAEAA